MPWALSQLADFSRPVAVGLYGTSARNARDRTARDSPLVDFSLHVQRCHATVTPASRYTSWIRFSSFTPSLIGRWNALRPLIRPMPPARLLITAVRAASAKSFAPLAPPLLISGLRPI